MTLTNISTHTISFTSALGVATQVGGTCVMPGSLAAGASCTVSMVAKPTHYGLSYFNVEINTDQVDSPHYIASKINGTGGILSLNTFNLSFPNTKIGTSLTGKVTARNIGDTDLHITSVTMAPSPSFQITSDCGTVIAGSSCAINVTFSPRLPNDNISSVTIRSDNLDSPVNGFNMNGVGLGTALRVAPASVTFPTVATNTTSSASVNLYNGSTAAINIKGLAVGAPFAATNGCVNPINPGYGCNISLSFKDASVGTFHGNLTITTDDTLGSYTIPLTGTTN